MAGIDPPLAIHPPQDHVMHFLRCALLLCLLLSAALPAAAVIYVKIDATGASDGTSWEDAYTDLQTALTGAVAGDTLWVAAGTYTPTADLTRNVGFRMRSGIVIYGGFAGMEEALDQRDIDANPTILSGEIGDPGPDDNTYHVVNGGGCDSTGVIDGFIVTAGNTDGTANFFGGGGMLIRNGGSPRIVNVTFRENQALIGGGMYLGEGASPSIVDVEFIDNTATGGISTGGGVRCEESAPTFRNVWFSGNTARLGGGLYVIGESTVTLVNAVFCDNIATDAGGTEGWGGGIYMNNSSIDITNAAFVDNWADTDAGGLYSADFGQPALVTVTNSILWGNNTTAGPDQISNVNGAVTTIDHSLIQDCGASGPDWKPSVGVDAGGNLEADPFFTDRAAGNLRLLFGSPAIEAGDNGAPDLAATDLDGKPRIIGPKVDMGPYETTPVCPPANVFYVDAAAAGARNGSSWPDAFTELAIALRVLDLCPGVDEIWVAGGSYTPAISDNRDETFRLRDGITIYGGFNGTEAQLTERDVPANPTILTGEIRNAGVSDNTYHVITSSGNDSTAVLDGFTVTAGNASGAPVPHGGGMISIASAPTVRNLVFLDNSGTLGGGLYADGGTPMLNDVVFTGNGATTLGGGAALTSVMDAGLYNVSFESNTASSGGGLYLQLGSAVLVNAVFSGNLVVNYGGGMYTSVAGAVTITNSTFSGNGATHGGGMVNNSSDPIVTNTILWNNGDAEIYNTAGASPVVSYSLVEGSGGSGAGWNPLLGVDGGNNIDEDPLFTDAPNHNLRLNPNSPAVDAGDNDAPYLPEMDRDENPRVIRGIVDMGAYEDDTGVGIGDPDTPKPVLGPAVRSIWPNPFNPLLMVDIELDRERPLQVDVYDIRGGHVRCLRSGMHRGGQLTLTWDGTDDRGHRVASGVYLLRFVSEEWRAHRKVVLLK